MPNSPPTELPEIERIKSYLTGRASGATLQIEQVDGSSSPLLLMSLPHLIAAFAFSSQADRKCFDLAYIHFKKLYSQRQADWDSVDLAFVCCAPEEAQHFDLFASNIEVDVYFCRKFAVKIGVDLDTSLARLPFLPLAPLIGKSLRPTSAQTFLQSCGVPAPLARYIVKQGERAAVGIADDCLAGKFGDLSPAQRPAQGAPLPTDALAAKPHKLEEISIRNFRAYRETQVFQIGSEVTVLYGPNGFGKTSFFDAIDFAVTGGIARIERSSPNEEVFAKTAKHLDSGAEESEVTLTFRGDDKVQRITRLVSSRRQGTLNNVSADRKTILNSLTGGSSPVADRVENLVALFRATHLFNQEQQELAKDFETNCQLSSEIVARLLAFEDYSVAVNKTEDVLEYLRKLVAAAEFGIKQRTEEIDAERKNLDQVSKSTLAQSNIESLETDLAALKSRVEKLGIAAAEKVDQVALRGWRAAIDGKLSDSQTRGNRLSALAKELAGMPELSADIQKRQELVAQQEQVIKAAEEKNELSKQALVAEDGQIVTFVEVLSRLQLRDESLEWALANIATHSNLLGRRQQTTQAIAAIVGTVAQSQLVVSRAELEYQTVETRITQLEKAIEVNQAEIAALDSLREQLPSWQKGSMRIAEIADAEKAIQFLLNQLSGEEAVLLSDGGAASANEARISKAIAEFDKGQSEVRALLSQLQTHVKTEHCPLCGENHGSKEELLRHIEQTIASDGASGLRAELIQLRAKIAEIGKTVGETKSKQEVRRAELAAMQREREGIQAANANFINAAAAVGLGLADSLISIGVGLGARSETLGKTKTDLEAQRQAGASELDLAKKKAFDSQVVLKLKENELEQLKATLDSIQKSIDQLHSDPKATELTPDQNAEKLTELSRNNKQQTAEATTKLAEARSKREGNAGNLHAREQEVVSAKLRLIGAREELSDLQRKQAEVFARLSAAGIAREVTEATVLEMVSAETTSQATLAELKDVAVGLEIALDAATTAAVVSRTQDAIRAKEAEIAKAQRELEAFSKWRAYFNGISTLVSSQQRDATENFTKDYGPRTSVIQKRLRSVYGFDDVEIVNRGSAIDVRVRRHGEDLRPTDYFSQSQVQTLLLGLFLTACSSQTWSGFAPVFLDDPITHFDDMNTYAFLDLVVGLLKSDFQRRQFVISTCDEKLLKLAQQKFLHLGEGAKFYKFTAFGESGPQVEVIPMT